jgi:hypothetical protein
MPDDLAKLRALVEDCLAFGATPNELRRIGELFDALKNAQAAPSIVAAHKPMCNALVGPSGAVCNCGGISGAFSARGHVRQTNTPAMVGAAAAVEATRESCNELLDLGEPADGA